LKSLCELEPSVRRKIESILEWFREKGGVVVAFSGGVDSSVVAALAFKALNDRVVVVTADSVTLPRGELEEAKQFATEIGVKHVVVKVDELANTCFTRNPPNRCYYCKKELISELKKVAEKYGLETIVDGTNIDDLDDHRPGALALKEEDVHSPLAELGVGKDEVRAIARYLGLSTADKPSMACLASRFPYGHPITLEGVHRVSEAEDFIRRLVKVKTLRVRDHGEIARIEVDRGERRLFFSESVLDAIDERLKTLGFKYVAFELGGYHSGSLNRMLERPITPSKVVTSAAYQPASGPSEPSLQPL